MDTGCGRGHRPRLQLQQRSKNTLTELNHIKRTMNIQIGTPSFLPRVHRNGKYCVQVLLAFGFLALSQMAQAVVPSPDGGYPGGNTAEGQNALFSLTTGLWNTALGGFTLWKNTDGNFNTAIGAGALLLNVGNQGTLEGVQNTAAGAAALLSNSTGSLNTATGVDALFSNTTGFNNTAIGYTRGTS